MSKLDNIYNDVKSCCVYVKLMWWYKMELFFTMKSLNKVESKITPLIYINNLVFQTFSIFFK